MYIKPDIVTSDSLEFRGSIIRVDEDSNLCYSLHLRGSGNLLLYNEMLPRKVSSSTMKQNARHLSVPSFTKIALTTALSQASTHNFARA
jgi:hypothetical protein